MRAKIFDGIVFTINIKRLYDQFYKQFIAKKNQLTKCIMNKRFHKRFISNL